jgi:hypothetical protein
VGSGVLVCSNGFWLVFWPEHLFGNVFFFGIQVQKTFSETVFVLVGSGRSCCDLVRSGGFCWVLVLSGWCFGQKSFSETVFLTALG